MDVAHNPGPGAYNSTNELNPEGKYSSSRIANPKSTTFAPKSSARFTSLNNKRNVPGPG